MLIDTCTHSLVPTWKSKLATGDVFIEVGEVGPRTVLGSGCDQGSGPRETTFRIYTSDGKVDEFPLSKDIPVVRILRKPA